MPQSKLAISRNNRYIVMEKKKYLGRGERHARIEICVNPRAMLRFDEEVAVVQKGGRGGCGPYCQNLRPRYRSTHRHTLEEPRGERGREEKEREGIAKEWKGENDWVQKCGKKAKRERKMHRGNQGSKDSFLWRIAHLPLEHPPPSFLAPSLSLSLDNVHSMRLVRPMRRCGRVLSGRLIILSWSSDAFYFTARSRQSALKHPVVFADSFLSLFSRILRGASNHLENAGWLRDAKIFFFFFSN